MSCLLLSLPRFDSKNIMSSPSLALTALLTTSLFVGCGGTSTPPPAKVYPVSGVITYKGKPVVGADVTFSNQESNRAAFGRTDDEGRYELTTFSQNDGAVEGKSLVTVAKFVAPVTTTPEASVESEDYEPPGFTKEEPVQKQQSEFPQKYSSAQTSGLFANVQPVDGNTFDFELK